MWTRERQPQCKDSEGRKQRHRLDSGISDDQNQETVFNCECQENKTVHSPTLSYDDKTFKLVPRTMYVLKECEPDDPDQIEVKRPK